MISKVLEDYIKNICKYEYPYFLNKDNVVGIGCGYKTIKNITTNEICIQVFVKKKVLGALLNKNNIIPKLFRGIKTDVIETGNFQTTSLIGRVRPVTGGYCVGLEGVDVSGTYGGLVSDKRFLYMLSNNHVIAGNNIAFIGNPILQSAEEFGGQYPRDVVAYLSKFIPLKFITKKERPINYVDAAVGTVANAALFSRDITYVGTPTGIDIPTLGVKVQMVGSASEYLSGEIKSIGVTLEVNFTGNLNAIFVDQILSTPTGDDGDSGAFLLDFNRKVIGLVFAVNRGYTVSNKITTVLESLDVKIVTG